MISSLLFGFLLMLATGSNVKGTGSLGGVDGAMQINWWTVNSAGVVLAADGRYLLSGCITSSPVGVSDISRYYGLAGGFWVSEFRFSPKVSREGQIFSLTMRDFKLYQNFPNPFRTKTSISYEIPTEQQVALLIYDHSGRLVKRLFIGRQQPGRYTIKWDGRNEIGHRCAEGIYFYMFKTEGYSAIEKIVITK